MGSTPAQESWLLLRSGPGGPAFNMALDEALLESVHRLGRPVLRFYGWSVPAASFGYAQAYADVEKLTPLRPLIRRPTGGGVVPHDRDWTYTLVFPPTHWWYELKARESYARLHRWVQAAFVNLGVAVDLAAVPAVGAPSHCFARAEQFDVLWAGAKIAGAAQRRNRHGFLIQGSVQPPAGVRRELWERELCRVASQTWRVAWEVFTPPGDLLSRAQELAATKFATDAHNRRR